MTTATVVEYCVYNVPCRDRVEVLDAETRGYPCLERCGRCRRSAMLIVDGEARIGESHAAILADLQGSER